MRVAALELVADPADDIVEREKPKFFRHLRVEDDLELKITKLVFQCLHVAAVDRVGHLIGFFDCVGGDGREILLQIPLAAALRVAEPAMIATSRSRFTRGPGDRSASIR